MGTLWKNLPLDSSVNSGDTEGLRLKGSARKASFLKFTEHRIAPHEALDRMVEIRKRANISARKDSAKSGHYKLEIKRIKRRYYWVLRVRELEDHQFAPRLQHTIHLFKTLLEISVVPHSIRSRQ